MAKIIEPTIADTYGSVAMISCIWIIMSYLFMPLGPLASVKNRTPGQQKWCVPGTKIFTRICIHRTQ